MTGSDQAQVNFRDRDYLQTALIPSLTEVVRTQNFSIEAVKARLIGFRVVYDRLMLPQRHPERPQWVTKRHAEEEPKRANRLVQGRPR